MKLIKGRIYTLTSDGDQYMFGGYTSRGVSMIRGISGLSQTEIQAMQKELQQQEGDEFLVGVLATRDFWSHDTKDIIDRIKRFGKVLEMESEEL